MAALAPVRVPCPLCDASLSMPVVATGYTMVDGDAGRELVVDLTPDLDGVTGHLHDAHDVDAGTDRLR